MKKSHAIAMFCILCSVFFSSCIMYRPQGKWYNPENETASRPKPDSNGNYFHRVSYIADPSFTKLETTYGTGEVEGKVSNYIDTSVIGDALSQITASEAVGYAKYLLDDPEGYHLAKHRLNVIRTKSGLVTMKYCSDSFWVASFVPDESKKKSNKASFDTSIENLRVFTLN